MNYTTELGMDEEIAPDQSKTPYEGTFSNDDTWTYGLLQGWVDTPFDDLTMDSELEIMSYSITSQLNHNFDDSNASSPGPGSCFGAGDANEFINLRDLVPYQFPQSSNIDSEFLTMSDFELSTSFSTSTCNGSSPNRPGVELDLSYPTPLRSPPSLSMLSGSVSSSSQLPYLDSPAVSIGASWASYSTPSMVSDKDGSQSSETGKKSKAPRAKKKKNRPCDIRREIRKVDKPEICPVCSKGHAWKRDLNRHLTNHHPGTAISMGLSLEKLKCEYHGCTKTFKRKDHKKRHQNKQHGGNRM